MGMTLARVFGAVVGAKAAREEAVTVSIVNYVVFGDTGGGKAARNQLGPVFDVPSRITDDRGFAGRAG